MIGSKVERNIMLRPDISYKVAVLMLQENGSRNNYFEGRNFNFSVLIRTLYGLLKNILEAKFSIAFLAVLWLYLVL